MQIFLGRSDVGTLPHFFAPQHVWARTRNERKQAKQKITSIKTKSNSRSAFFTPRVATGCLLCSVGVFLTFAALSQSVTDSSRTSWLPTIANPVPLINQPLVPDAVAPAGGGFTLTVNGPGFVSGSVVNWNGSARATTFVNGSQLTAAIPASDIATASTASITMGGPITETATFTRN